MTGYLGGAVATHLRIADTARAAIPLVTGILAWGGLYLRDSRIRQLVRSAGRRESGAGPAAQLQTKYLSNF